ncbi:MAG: VOC family protein [Pseudomonas sp.]
MQLLVNIDVPDLDAAITFYTQAFDLRLSRRLFDGDVAELLGGPAPLYLLHNPGGSTACMGVERDYRRHWTPLHLDFVVEDLPLACDRVLAAGARSEGAIRNEVWGRIASFADPFGHGFCLLQWQGRGYAEVSR